MHCTQEPKQDLNERISSTYPTLGPLSFSVIAPKQNDKFVLQNNSSIPLGFGCKVCIANVSIGFTRNTHIESQ